MALAARLRMTEEEFLDYALHHEEERPEYLNGEVLPMEATTIAHAIVGANVVGALLRRLDGSPCRPLMAGAHVLVRETGMYAIPDVVVVCGTPERSNTRPACLVNPRVLVEVLFASTADYDRGTKLRHYRRRPTVDAVVLVDSTTRCVEVHTRNADGTWTVNERTKGSGRFIGIELTFDEIYEGADEAMAADSA